LYSKYFWRRLFCSGWIQGFKLPPARIVPSPPYPSRASPFDILQQRRRLLPSPSAESGVKFSDSEPLATMPTGYPRNARLRPSTARSRPAVLLTTGALADRLRLYILPQQPPVLPSTPALTLPETHRPPGTSGVPALRRRCAFARRPGSGIYRRARELVNSADEEECCKQVKPVAHMPDPPQSLSMPQCRPLPLLPPVLPPVQSLDRPRAQLRQIHLMRMPALPLPQMVAPLSIPAAKLPVLPQLQSLRGLQLHPLRDVQNERNTAVIGQQRSQQAVVALGKRKRQDQPNRPRGRPWTFLASIGRPPLPPP
jgi:hypothetical protein